MEKSSKAQWAFNYLQKLLEELGVEEAKKKASPPATRMAFLVIGFDTRKMIMEVTPERLIEIKELTVRWLEKRKHHITKRTPKFYRKIEFCGQVCETCQNLYKQNE